MRKQSSRVLWSFLSLIIVASLITVNITFFNTTNAYADEITILSGKCGDNATWEYDQTTGVLVIDGTGDLYKDYSFEIDANAVIVNEGITSISDYAFYNSKLFAVSLPSTLKSIGNRAFWGCKNLANLEIPSGVETLGNVAFENCTALESISVDEENKYFSSEDGVLYNKDKTVLLLYPAGSKNTTFSIPDSVKELGYYAFDYNQNLKTLTIPVSVENIGSDEPFIFAKSLIDISVDGGNSYYCSVNGSLYNKDKTKLIKYAIGKSSTTFDIPNGVKEINDRAFGNATSLIAVFLPSSVTKIGYAAFEKCSTLREITILNTECTINNAVDVKEAVENGLTIYGYDDSTASEYASSNNIKFEALREKTVDSISISSLPKKTIFAVGDTFNSVGLTITINYTDGTSATRSKGLIVEGFDSSILGTQTLTVTYSDKTTTYDVEIVAQLEDEIIEIGETKTVDIIEKGQVYYIYFTPTVSGKYDFYAESDTDTYGAIYDSDNNELISNDDSDSGSDFYISYDLEAGKTYIFASNLLDENELGSFNVTVKVHEDKPVEPETPTTPVPENPTTSDKGNSETTAPQVTTKPDETTTSKIKKPKRVKLSKPKNVKGKKVKLKWKKVKNIDGYEIMYARNKKFTKGKKKITNVKASAKKKTIKKLKKKKTYYFKIRAYKLVNGKKVYGKWSKVKKVKIKK